MQINNSLLKAEYPYVSGRNHWLNFTLFTKVSFNPINGSVRKCKPLPVNWIES